MKGKSFWMLALGIVTALCVSFLTVSEVKAFDDSKIAGVETVDELMEAIDDNMTVILAPGEYNITQWLQEEADIDEWEEGTTEKGLYFTEEYEGPELVLCGFENLTIVSVDRNDPASLICEPGHADVMSLVSCKNILLDTLVMGHYPEVGECTGSVLSINDSAHITVSDSELYGCGVYGLYSDHSEDIRFIDCKVHDCSDGCVYAEYSDDLHFIHCDFYDCTGLAFCLNDATSSLTGCKLTNLRGGFTDTYDLIIAACDIENCFDDFEDPDAEKPENKPDVSEPAGNKPDETEAAGRKTDETEAAGGKTDETKPAGNKTDEPETAEISTLPVQWDIESFFDDMDEDDYGYYTYADRYYISQEDYPELADALNSYNDNNTREMNNRLKELRERIQDEYVPDEESWRVFTLGKKLYLNRADDIVLSFTEYTNFDGINGDPESEALGINIDTQTGKDVDLLDVVVSKQSFETAFEHALETTDFYVGEWKDAARKIVADALGGNSLISSPDGLSFTVDYRGLTLIFNGSGTGFDDGPCTIFLSFEEYPELFSEKYMTVPSDYMIELAKGNFESVYWFDFNGDGIAEPFSVIWNEDEEGEGMHTVSARWEDTVFPLTEIGECYDMNAYLMHNDGKDFLYAEATQGNDYETIYIYEITTEAVDYVGEAYGTLKFVTYAQEEDTDFLYGYLPVDPDSFMLESPDYTMGFEYVMSEFVVSDDGFPSEQDVECRYLPFDTWYYRAVKDIDAEYTEEGKEDEKHVSGTIKEGSYVKPYKINRNIDVLTLETQDGKQWYLDFTSDGDSCTYNGEELRDLFADEYGMDEYDIFEETEPEEQDTELNEETSKKEDTEEKADAAKDDDMEAAFELKSEWMKDQEYVLTDPAPKNLKELKEAVDVTDPRSVAAYFVWSVNRLTEDYDDGMAMMKYLFADIEPYGRGYTEGGASGKAGWDSYFNERLKDGNYSWLPGAYFEGGDRKNDFKPSTPVTLELYYNSTNTKSANEQSLDSLGRLNIVYWVKSHAGGNQVNITLSRFEGTNRYYVTSGTTSGGLFYQQ